MILRIVHLFLILLLIVTWSDAQSFIYRSPVPNSDMNSRETNIILRSSLPVDASSLQSDDLQVTGSRTGSHSGTLILADDGRTLMFQPDVPFAPKEVVTVRYSGGITDLHQQPVAAEQYQFTVTPNERPLSERYAVTDAGEVVLRTERSRMVPWTAPLTPSDPSDPLPSDFPKFTVVRSSGAADGYFFLTTTDEVAGVGHFYYTVNNNGEVVKYQRVAGHIYDFKMQPNGLLSYADPVSDWGYAGGSRVVHRVIDSSFAPVDSFRAGNGYDADSHEFLMLPNGHVLLHAYDIQYMDLSKTIPGASANAIVVGSIMQELDRNKRVVFQWRSWDHIPVSETYMNTAASAFDYIHVNAYDIDTDGNLLLCFRNTCDIVKVDRLTGAIIWRMGGKKNQFTFIGENPANAGNYYTFPHSLRRLPNGNFLLFDNGNLHTQQVSRGVEYAIDQTTKTATMVWQYRHTPDVYTPTRGSVQKLPNGNRVIGWGSAPFVGVGKTMITELSPDDSVLFEMECNDKMPSYRAHKFVWNGHRTPAADVQLAELLPGNTYSFNKGDTNRTGITLTLTDATFGYNGVRVLRYPFAPVNASFPLNHPTMPAMRWDISQSGITSFTAEVKFDSTVLKGTGDLRKMVVYHREFEGSGMFFPLATVYDSISRSLTATTTKFGEFIIGIPELVTVAPPAPSAVLPLKGALANQTRPLLIRWSTAGHVTGYQLQVTTDTSSGTYAVNDPALKSSYILWTGYTSGVTYFWRARVTNEAGTGPWSSWSNFTMFPIYLTVTAPTAGQRLNFNASTVLSYQNNFEERVNLRLYRNGSLVLKIKDSTENTGRYVWKVPASGLTADSTYTLRVSSALDSTIKAESVPFTIASPVSVGRESGPLTEFRLAQNFPNPFNPSTMIEFSLPGTGASAAALLEVFNTLGQRIAVLWQGPAATGVAHRVTFDAGQLPAGIYLARLTSGSSTGVRKMVLVK